MWTVIIVLFVVLCGDFLICDILDKMNSSLDAREIRRESEGRIASMKAESARLRAETAQIEKDMQEKRDFIERRMAAFEERAKQKAHV
ncbi:MAG: hypothetical protein IKZ87_07855 [Actinomycetaceae bacterium]|nr:hypothetical protein [Actinomycetaceae bacterium]